MITHNLTKNLCRALCALFLAYSGLPAEAGPGPHENYVPVKTQAEAMQIKPGDQIAVRCGICGSVTTFAADKDMSFLHSYVCENCRRKFIRRTVGNGQTVGFFTYEDDAGHQATLLRKK